MPWRWFGRNKKKAVQPDREEVNVHLLDVDGSLFHRANSINTTSACYAKGTFDKCYSASITKLIISNGKLTDHITSQPGDEVIIAGNTSRNSRVGEVINIVKDFNKQEMRWPFAFDFFYYYREHLQEVASLKNFTYNYTVYKDIELDNPLGTELEAAREYFDQEEIHTLHEACYRTEGRDGAREAAEALTTRLTEDGHHLTETDGAKIQTHLMFAHALVEDNLDKRFIIHTYDDLETILDKQIHVFAIYPELLPKQVELRIYHYKKGEFLREKLVASKRSCTSEVDDSVMQDMTDGAGEPYISIKGIGEYSPHYRDALHYLTYDLDRVSLIPPYAKGSDDEKDLAQRLLDNSRVALRAVTILRDGLPKQCQPMLKLLRDIRYTLKDGDRYIKAPRRLRAKISQLQHALYKGKVTAGGELKHLHDLYQYIIQCENNEKITVTSSITRAKKLLLTKSLKIFAHSLAEELAAWQAKAEQMTHPKLKLPVSLVLLSLCLGLATLVTAAIASVATAYFTFWAIPVFALAIGILACSLLIACASIISFDFKFKARAKYDDTQKSLGYVKALQDGLALLEQSDHESEHSNRQSSTEDEGPIDDGTKPDDKKPLLAKSAAKKHLKTLKRPLKNRRAVMFGSNGKPLVPARSEQRQFTRTSGHK